MIKEKKYNLVYKTTNLINNKIYIGVHITDILDDGYIGCGIRSPKNTLGECHFHRAVRKHGYQNFKREILYNFGSAELAYWWESYLVDEDFLKRKDVYNKAPGGRGGSKKGRILGTSWNKGKKCPNISASRKGQQAKNRKKILCITTGEIFDCRRLAIEKYPTACKIYECCNGNRLYAGKLLDGTLLQWRYL